MYKKEISQNETNTSITYTLVEKVEETNNVLTQVNDLVGRIKKEKQLDENLIKDLKINYKRRTREVCIELDYCKVNPEYEEHIYSVLKKIGYDAADIMYVTKNNLNWVVKISDQEIMRMRAEYDFYSAKEREQWVKNEIKKEYGYDVLIDFM